MEVRIHFTHGLPATNQVDLFIRSLQNPSWFNCSHSKGFLCAKCGHNVMCLAAGICFSYSFVKRGICIPKQVGMVWKSNSLHAWKPQSVTHTLAWGAQEEPNWPFQAKLPQAVMSEESIKHSPSVKKSLASVIACCRFKVFNATKPLIFKVSFKTEGT